MEHPVLVMSGWRAWPHMSNSLAKRLRKRLGLGPHDQSVYPIWFHNLDTFDQCVERAVTKAHKHFGPETELEVVAVSMGGLIARKAIIDGHDGRHINARRLFTLATPHKGAKLAKLISLDSTSRDMRPGCDFLCGLEKREAAAWGTNGNGDATRGTATVCDMTRPYELVCYARLGDAWVGSTNTAPSGMHPIWVEPRRFQPSHLAISADARIIDDIARRIMGEEPSLKENGPAPRD